jgi:hypothetical protein
MTIPAKILFAALLLCAPSALASEYVDPPH